MTQLSPLFLLLLSLLTLSQSKEIELEWYVPVSPEVYANYTATVGDTVFFRWGQAAIHNAYIHPSGTCDETGRILLGSQWDNTEYKFKAEDAGKTMVFACDYLSHCSRGQIVRFEVEGKGVAVTSAPTAKPVDSSSSSSSSSEEEDPVKKSDDDGGDKVSSESDDNTSGMTHRSNDVLRLAVLSIGMVSLSLCTGL